ncbi:hypothetical protein M9H77_30129 [Catharanthus roseus]|uniref:Uncharacterized protein n=1 Tax=Catharanthus roseus TaxID=4058 RepID=A0ACB9ZXP4_CATRO|nr:hypothetical protein M9H77_30129 [Catharanthus roseus]
MGAHKVLGLDGFLHYFFKKVLSHQINATVANGIWKRTRLSRIGPTLSHLCFVDDLLLFGVTGDLKLRENLWVRVMEAKYGDIRDVDQGKVLEELGRGLYRLLQNRLSRSLEIVNIKVLA